MTVIRNLTAGDIALDDLSGITLGASADLDLTLLEISAEQIASSNDLSTNITGGNIVFLDGQGNAMSQQETEDAITNSTSVTPAVVLQDEGSNVTGTPHSKLNFTGTGVSISDAGSGVATITVSGGGGSGGPNGVEKVMNSWTALSGNLFYNEFIHNLGTTAVTVFLRETSNDQEVRGEYIEIIDANTIRVVVEGNSENITATVVAGGVGSPSAGGGATQDLWETIDADTGSTTANTPTDTFTIAGGTNIQTTISGDTLTIDALTSAPLQTYTFFADQVDFPTSGSDWDITNGAPGSVDSNNSSLVVRLFDDTTQEAFGMSVRVHPNATDMIVRTRVRAETGSNAAVIFNLHRRQISDNAAVGAWTDSALTTVNVTSNEFWHADETSDTLANWGMSAGEVYQLMLSRDTGAGGDTLSGDAAVLLVEIEFN